MEHPPTKPAADPQKINIIDVNQFAPSEVAEIDLYQKREKIYTRKIEGFFQRIRLYTGWPLLIGYFLLPFIEWQGRPIVLFDLPARKFHILGLTFWPQDFAMLAWLLAIAAFALFLFTALFGRIWCGYTCPQTVWTSIFMWIEQRVEGSRNQRIKLDSQPWNLAKASKKLLKHAMWMAVAFFTGLIFIGYFTPINDLIYDFLTFSVAWTPLFWVLFFTAATYLNAGWLREQVCMYMCPYARFQSAMFDRNTLIVSYDAKRGETRGSRKHVADYKSEGLGDCINCQLCVQVCPTGIDIRDGLQYQCIGCALCIDACDSVMEKMHYPKGLIRYTTENQLLGISNKKFSHQLLRPRVLGYATAILVMVSLLSYRLITRTPFDLDVIRDRNQLYIQKDDGRVENNYMLNVINMDNNRHQFVLSIENDQADKNLISPEIVGDKSFSLESGEVKKVPVRLSLSADLRHQPSQNIYFVARAQDDSQLHARHESRFIMPTQHHSEHHQDDIDHD
jgi:cytochrome c oxidase accessory protein FixG